MRKNIAEMALKTIVKHKNQEVRRKQIIDAARKLIIRRGSEHVTVRGIAKIVGISEGAIYRHFKSKRDILAFMTDDIENSLLEDLIEASGNGNRSLEVLDSILRSHLSAIEKRRGVSFQVIAEIISLGDKRLNGKISDKLNKYIGHLAELLSQGVKSGEVRDDIDLEATAMIAFGTIQGLVNIWALSNYSFDPQGKYMSIWSILREVVSKRREV